MRADDAADFVAAWGDTVEFRTWALTMGAAGDAARRVTSTATWERLPSDRGRPGRAATAALAAAVAVVDAAVNVDIPDERSDHDG